MHQFICSKSKIEKMFGNGGSKMDKNSFWDTGQIVKLIYSENKKDGDKNNLLKIWKLIFFKNVFFLPELWNNYLF